MRFERSFPFIYFHLVGPCIFTKLLANTRTFAVTRCIMVFIICYIPSIYQILLCFNLIFILFSLFCTSICVLLYIIVHCLSMLIIGWRVYLSNDKLLLLPAHFSSPVFSLFAILYSFRSFEN